MTGKLARPRPRFHALAAGVALACSAAQPHLSEAATPHPSSNGTNFGAASADGLIGKLHTRRVVAPAASVPSLLVASVVSCADDGGIDTLRYAVSKANSGDTILLTGLACGKITLQSAIPIVVDDLTIEGPGADKLTIDGNAADRVFLHAGQGTLALTGLTVANGKVAADKAYGGCIYTKGSLTLTSAVVTGCQAIGLTRAIGGGVVVYNTLKAESSTFSNNVADATVGALKTVAAGGGGIFAHALTLQHSVVSGNTVHAALGSSTAGGAIGSAITAKYSTISGNAANAFGDAANYSSGGGIAVAYSLFAQSSTVDNNAADLGGGIAALGNDGFVTVLQSTISSNDGRIGGGGILSVPPLSLGNGTVAFNTSGAFGSGGVAALGATTLQSSILFGNTPSDIDAKSTLVGANNIIRIVGPDVVAVPPMTIALDPNLGPLSYNGGVTRTHLPGANSPAIDAGNNVVDLPLDQRGATYARVVGAAPDIGAVEVDADHIFGSDFGS